MAIIHTKPSLTIFADASAGHHQMVAGWGGWARRDDAAPIYRSGICQFSIDMSLVEGLALLNMMRKCREEDYFKSSDKSIVLQSDNLQMLNILHYGLRNSWSVKVRHNKDSKVTKARYIPELFKQIMPEFIRLTAHCDVVYLKHIKGHQGGGHSRSSVNEICDALAKKAMKGQLQ